MSGIQSIGGALSNAGSVFGAAGVPFAPIIAGVGGVLTAIFGSDEGAPLFGNPLPVFANPYETQGLLWGLPVHPRAVEAWAAHLPVKAPGWSPAAPGGAPGAAVWGPEYVARGGFKGFNLANLAETTVVHQGSSGNALNVFSTMQVGRFSKVHAAGGQLGRPWGYFGEELDTADFINARLDEILLDWEAVNDPDFEPVFWELDYRTWDQKLRAIFSELPIDQIHWWLGQGSTNNGNSQGDMGAAATLWYDQVGGLEGHWTDWYVINQALPAAHAAKVEEWMEWRTALWLESVIADSISTAQGEAEAAVIAQFENALNPSTDGSAPAVIVSSSSGPSDPSSISTAPASTSTSSTSPILLNSITNNPVLGEPENGSLVIGALAALALLIA